jgi:hypothetical protein
MRPMCRVRLIPKLFHIINFSAVQPVKLLPAPPQYYFEMKSPAAHLARWAREVLEGSITIALLMMHGKMLHKG